jgi:excisionase family DNA binding protein
MLFQILYRLEVDKMDSNDRWLSLAEICNYLGISRDTALKWINIKNMPAHKVGRLWKFRTSEIDEWVKSGGAAEK